MWKSSLDFNSFNKRTETCSSCHHHPHVPVPNLLLSCRINNCVGEDNHWLFLQLCLYAQILSLFTLALDFCQYYYFQPLTRLDQVTCPRSPSSRTTPRKQTRPSTGSASASQEKFTTRHELALLRVSALMGLIMFAGMTGLFHTQLTGILTVSTESRELLPSWGSLVQMLLLHSFPSFKNC